VGHSIGARGISGTNDSDGSSEEATIFFNLEYKNEKGEGEELTRTCRILATVSITGIRTTTTTTTATLT
jgi:hypothetical protein